MGHRKCMPGWRAMRKIVLFILLLFFYDAPAAERPDHCAKTRTIDIINLHSPIRIVGEPEKKSVIQVRIQIDCRTRRVILPVSMSHALELLDSSLPLDFKAAITKGSYINPYFYGHYGASVEQDLDDFFSDLWNLKEDKPLCQAALSKYEDYGSCFGVMLNLLRNQYSSANEDEEGNPLPSGQLGEHKGKV